jgi:hypothetical protein
VGGLGEGGGEGGGGVEERVGCEDSGEFGREVVVRITTG